LRNGSKAAQKRLGATIAMPVNPATANRRQWTSDSGEPGKDETLAHRQISFSPHNQIDNVKM
jgi:hypothetical protein